MEELLQETRKQLKLQKIITAFLAVLVALLIAMVVMIGSYAGQMTAAMDEAVEKIQEIDVEGVNDAITTTQELLNNVDELSDAVGDVTQRVQEFDSWISGIFGN